MYKRTLQGWFKHFDFIILDVACIQLSFVLAYIMRHGLLNPYKSFLYRNMSIVLMLITVLVDVFFSIQKNVLKRGYYMEFAATLKQSVLVVLFASFYLVFVQYAQLFSRFVLYIMGLLYVLIGYGFRCMWKRFLLYRRKGGGVIRVLIVTTDSLLGQTLSDIKTNNYRLYQLAGAAVIDQNRKGKVCEDIEVVADREDVVDYVCREWVDEIFVNLPQGGISIGEDGLLDQFTKMGVTVHIMLAKVGARHGKKQFVEKIGNNMVLTTSLNYFTPGQAFVKRLFDVLGGIIGCMVTAVLTLVLAPVIFISSPGPVFFSQVRIGRNGKEFKMYKFRSMYMDAEERKKDLLEQNRNKDGMMFKLDFDPRIIGNKRLPDGTKKEGIGAFIRKHSLDEFPQFFNCLMGSMSLVGTRPPTVDEWNKYDLHHRARLAVKPGITGLWQVSGRSEITDFEEVVGLDREYIDNWSLWTDIKILLKTVKVMFIGKGTM